MFSLLSFEHSYEFVPILILLMACSGLCVLLSFWIYVCELCIESILFIFILELIAVIFGVKFYYSFSYFSSMHSVNSIESSLSTVLILELLPPFYFIVLISFNSILTCYCLYSCNLDNFYNFLIFYYLFYLLILSVISSAFLVCSSKIYYIILSSLSSFSIISKNDKFVLFVYFPSLLLIEVLFALYIYGVIILL